MRHDGNEVHQSPGQYEDAQSEDDRSPQATRQRHTVDLVGSSCPVPVDVRGVGRSAAVVGTVRRHRQQVCLLTCTIVVRHLRGTTNDCFS